MKTKEFSRAFKGCAGVSAVVIVFGVVGFFVRGINFAIDFVPGLSVEARIAPAAARVSYTGDSEVSLQTTATSLDVVIGSGAESETASFAYADYPTVDMLCDELSSIEGLSAQVQGEGGALSSSGVYLDGSSSSHLYAGESLLLFAPVESSLTAEDVREKLADQGFSVKETGAGAARSFQVRAALSKDDTSDALLTRIVGSLKTAFGGENVAVLKSDFVGSSFSSGNTVKAVLLAIVTLLAIWIYAAVRFHWDFALGAIVALVHDCLVMFTFITWSQVEFSTTTFAAVLTIFGYSINATVVILDRVRENLRLMDAKTFNEVLNASISATLTRSIITTVTTLFASLALLLFTTGSIRDFAAVLTVGLVSGCYSSLFISSGFISFARRHWKPVKDMKTGGKTVYAFSPS